MRQNYLSTLMAAAVVKGGVIIPARLKSTRLPGKPLAYIAGKTMVQRVMEKCWGAVGHKNVFIATDSEQIADHVIQVGGQVVMTSAACQTGTDRIAEANESLSLDFVVNVQGDEPMIRSDDISRVFEMMRLDQRAVLNCCTEIEDCERDNPNIPKVVLNRLGGLIYISRGGVPFGKDGNSRAVLKQVCIYGFGKEHLSLFAEEGHKTSNEEIEDIEILRFLDLGIEVRMLKVKPGGIAVDTPEDLKRVRFVLEERCGIENRVGALP